MTREEWLLTCLAEEASELTKRATKALRFGLNEIQDGQNNNNAVRIMDEFTDVLTVMYMLSLLDESIPVPHILQARILKREQWLHYAVTQGIVK